MPLTSDVNRWEYVGDGVTPDFAYENLIFAATDLDVYFDEVIQVSGFSVSNVGVETGGKVTPTPVVAAGVKIVIVRAVPFTQPQDFVDNEAVDAQAFEDGLNRMTIQAQQLRDTIGRQVTLSPAEPAGADMTVPALAGRLGQYWGGDAIDGALVAFAAPAGTTAVSVFMAGVITAADAAAARAALDAATDGYKVVESSPVAMTVDIGAGAFFNEITKARVINTVQTTAAITAPSVNPRNDIAFIDRLTGVKGVETGTEAVTPVDPVLTAAKVPLARIRLAISTTNITDAIIDDIREVNLLGSPAAGVSTSQIALNDQPLQSVASAATVDLTILTTENIFLTGTASVSDFGAGGAGLRRSITAGGTFTLVHGTGDGKLLLPGAANIVAEVDDTFVFLKRAGSSWQLESYKLQSGKSIVPAGLTQLDKKNISSPVATVDFITDINAIYDEYEIHIHNLTVVNDDVEIWLRVWDVTLGDWQSGAADYAWKPTNTNPTNAAHIPLTGVTGAGDGVGNGAAEAFSTVVKFFNPANTTQNKLFTSQAAWTDAGGDLGGKGIYGFYKGATNAITKIRIRAETGNIATGDFYLFGVNKS